VLYCHAGSSFCEIAAWDKRKSFLCCISYIGGEKKVTNGFKGVLVTTFGNHLGIQRVYIGT
ncbi:MAG: hypothetical protein O8C65_03255, partial [Candidatus Methanoperedens sp.]|nr:hypothetical protein [Candidatus Methanoperedens sp.]